MKINKKVLICTIIILLSLFVISKKEEVSKILGLSKEKESASCENAKEKLASTPNYCETNQSSLFMGCSNTF